MLTFILINRITKYRTENITDPNTKREVMYLSVYNKLIIYLTPNLNF